MKRFWQIGITSLLSAVTLLSMPWHSPAVMAQTPRLLEELELTDDQRAQIREVFEARRAEIGEILTEEQQQQFREAYQESQNFQAAVAEIENLTEDQKADLRTVVQASRQDIQEILTEEQLAELRSLIQERVQNRS